MLGDEIVPSVGRAVTRIRRTKREVHERYVPLDVGMDSVAEGVGSTTRNPTTAILQSDRSEPSNSLALDEAQSLALDTASNALDIDGNICGDTEEGRIDFSFIENNLDLYASEVLQDVQYQNLAESGTIDSESEVEESLHDLIPSGALDNEGAATTSVDSFPSPSESLVKWQTILALLLTSGTVKISVKQYELVCGIMKWQASRYCSAAELLPSYSTLQRRLKPMIYQCSYARSSVK